jgi:hypothetical protein
VSPESRRQETWEGKGRGGNGWYLITRHGPRSFSFVIGHWWRLMESHQRLRSYKQARDVARKLLNDYQKAWGRGDRMREWEAKAAPYRLDSEISG